MKTPIRLANLELHAWSGMLISFILYVVFVCGSFALFKDQTIRWNQPELRKVIEQPISLDELMGVLAKEAPRSHTLNIRLPNGRVPYYEVYRRATDESGFKKSYYNLAGEKITATENAIALDLVDELHRDLLFPNGKYVVGLASLFMLFALLTGLVYHWKNLGRDLFKLRLVKTTGKTSKQIKAAKRVFWLDLHNLTGVIGLPFHLMYAFTGAFFSLILVYQLSVGLVVFKGDTNAILAATGRTNISIDTGNKQAVLPQGIDALYADVLRTSNDDFIRRIIINGFGDANQQIDFETEKLIGFSSWGHSRYLLKTGELISQHDSDDNSALIKTLAVINKIHMVNFNQSTGHADLSMHHTQANMIPWLYFFLGLSGAIMILSGNLLWLQKKKKAQRASPIFNACFARLNLAIGLGLWSAMAVLALTAHTLPWSLENRALWQESIFFISWGLVCIYAFATRLPLLTSAAKLACMTAIIIMLTPISHTLATGDGLFSLIKFDQQTLTSQQYNLMGIDGFLCVLSVIFFYISYRLAHRKSNQPT